MKQLAILGTGGLLFLMSVQPCLAQDRGDPAGQRKAMKKLEWMIGNWKGGGSIEVAPGRKFAFTGTETIQGKLGGVNLLLEGKHHSSLGGGEAIPIHETLAIISYDEATKKYRFRAYTADGNFVDTEMKVTEKGFEWGFKEPLRGAMLRFTATYDGESKWDEIGDASMDDGKTWRKFFTMTMERDKK